MEVFNLVSSLRGSNFFDELNWTTGSEHVEDTSTLMQYVEHQLHLLLLINILDVKRLVSYDQICNIPIKEGKTGLHIKRTLMEAPRLSIVNSVNAAQNVEVFSVKIDCVLQFDLVALIHSDKTLEHVTRL